MENGADKSLLNGSSLSGLAGVTAKTFERVQVPVRSLADVLQEIHRLGATGTLTVHYAGGAARGAEWVRETGEKSKA